MPKEPEKIKSIHSKKCAVAHALEIIGGKWRLPIIWELSAKDSMRYNELKRHLDGITNIMLTRALNGLEKNGLVLRKEICQIPPHVEYSLTESCKQLLPALETPSRPSGREGEILCWLKKNRKRQVLFISVSSLQNFPEILTIRFDMGLISNVVEKRIKDR